MSEHVRFWTIQCATLFLVAFAGIDARAEDGADSVPDYNILVTPDSPAFTLLGVSPTEVQRPTTPRAVAVSLSKSFVGGSSLSIPEDFALEVSPYWLSSHPMLTLSEYQEDSSDSWYQNFTISVATSKFVDEETDASATFLAIGIRTSAIDPRPKDPCIGELRTALKEVYTPADLAKIGAIARLKELHGRDPTSEDVAKDTQVVAAMAAADKDWLSKRELVDTCRDKLMARYGVAIDLAAAVSFVFPEAEFSEAKVARAAGWATVAYLGRNHSASLLARVQGDRLDTDDSGVVVDVGARWVGAWDRYAVSAEAIYRHDWGDAVSNSDQYRVALAFDVRLTGDTWLTTTFGRQFSPDDTASLIAMANLKVNLGERVIEKP